jgi:alanine-glyoxylate transaminase / serine-glyoxylate transaminase / serine-pyruvate transaminase
MRVGRLKTPLTSSIFPTLAIPKQASQRLSLISRHLQNRPSLEINTPYSTERISQPIDDLPYTPLVRPPPEVAKPVKPKIQVAKMSSQPEHPTLLIPGPIEFDDAVLQSMSHYRYVFDTLAHTES